MPCGPQCRCCIIGDCCPPGSAEQRTNFKEWLLEKLADTHVAEHLDDAQMSAMVDAWLNELPWKKD